MIGLDRKTPVAFRDRGNAYPRLYAHPLRFGDEHIDDLLGRPIAEQLAVVALVIGDAMQLHQPNEIMLGVAGHGRDAETRIVRQIVVGRGAQVGEIGAPPAGDTDLLRDFRRGLQHQHPPPAPVGRRRAHEARRPGTDDNDIKIMHGMRMAVRLL